MTASTRPVVVAGADAAFVAGLARAMLPAARVVTAVPGQCAPGPGPEPVPAVPGLAPAVPVPAGPDGWARAAAGVERAFGTPRAVVVAPAPVAPAGPGDLGGPAWQAALAGNLGVAAAVSRAFAPVLARQRPASIVFVTWQYVPGPGQAHLAAAAGAVASFALSLAADLGEAGITVNAVTAAAGDLAAAGAAAGLLAGADAGYLTGQVLAPASASPSVTGTRP